ncbi:MAG TPA: SOS response-associated peptidase [Anaeromyxobacter sp.]
MCGRFTLTERDVASLARAWAAEVDGALAAGWRPRYNVAPGDRHLVLRATAAGRRLEQAVFGLPAPGGTLHVNARVETAGSRPAFSDAWRLRRCAVPADGFFEWDGPAGARRPTWFHRADGRPLLLAAILGASRDGGLAFAILTTGANAEVRRLHDRMPVIVAEERLDAWLSGPPPVLAAPADGLLAERAVSARVNSVENDDPGCLAPEPQLRLL